MVQRLNQLGEGGAQKVPQQGHEGLEGPEPQAHDDHVAQIELADGQALTDGHGKSVHGKAHS